MYVKVQIKKRAEMAALPQAIEAQILPSPSQSILKLLQYDLPIQHQLFYPVKLPTSLIQTHQVKQIPISFRKSLLL